MDVSRDKIAATRSLYGPSINARCAKVEGPSSRSEAQKQKREECPVWFRFRFVWGKTKCRDEIGKKGFLLGLAFLCSGVSVSAFLFFPGRENQLDGSVKGQKEPRELD